MADRHNDQADGLRRMFAHDRLRVIHIVAGCAGVGRLAVAVNLGVALAKAGRESLIMDIIDDRQQATALDYLGLADSAPHDAASAPIVIGPHGLAVLTLARDSRQAPLRAAQITGYCASLSYVLVLDSSTRCTRWIPINDQCREFIVVLSRTASSITDAYALIKRMSAAGVCRRFHVLINRVGSDAEATLIFRNMSKVARGYLDVELELLGFIPADPAIAVAAGQRRSLLDTSPETPAAKAFVRLAHKAAAWPQPASIREIAERPLAIAAS